VKTIVFTGDCFDSKHPTSSQLKLFSQNIRYALDNGIEIVLVAGNHDQQRGVSTTTLDSFDELSLPNLTVYQDFGLHETVEGVNIILMPYKDRRMIGTPTNSDAIEVIKNRIHELRGSVEGQTMIVGHFMLERAPDGVDPDKFSINELILPLQMFKGFDTVIMGHIHEHMIISKKDPVIMYSGSMDRISFGEKDYKKVSLIVDSKDIRRVSILRTKVRDLVDISLDYIGHKKPYKDKINKRIIGDIKRVNKQTPIKSSIVKVAVKMKTGDLYHMDHSLIKDFVMGLGASFCVSVQAASVSSRQLRNKAITETVSEKKAFESYLNGVVETPAMKKRMLKCAEQIIDSVGEK